jgi:hypothetical protein
MEDPVVPVPTDHDLSQSGVPEPGAPVALVGDPLPAYGEQTLDSLVNLEEDDNQWLQSNDESASVRPLLSSVDNIFTFVTLSR